MTGTVRTLRIVLGALMLSGATWSLLAQSPGEQGQKSDNAKRSESGARKSDDQGKRRGEGPGGPRNFDPEQFRLRMMDELKTALGASDEEWKALSPKVEKVMTASREARFQGMGFGGRPFGGPGGGPPGGGPGGTPGGNSTSGQQNQSPIAKASNDLRTALEDKSVSAEEIGKKLTALRDARTKAKDELNSAQKELRELLTQRQEAILVMRQILD